MIKLRLINLDSSLQEYITNLAEEDLEGKNLSNYFNRQEWKGKRESVYHWNNIMKEGAEKKKTVGVKISDELSQIIENRRIDGLTIKQYIIGLVKNDLFTGLLTDDISLPEEEKQNLDSGKTKMVMFKTTNEFRQK